MNLPEGLRQLTTVEEVKQAWGDLFVYTPEDSGIEEVAFANNPRVAITAEAVFVQLRRPIKAGPNVELTDVLRIAEPTVQDVRATDRYKGDIEKAICLLSTVAQIPNAAVDRMAASDMKLCGDVIDSFLA